jgi:hydroxymethylpyrimidine pyrophosphatase-like HAD family hydrolase
MKLELLNINLQRYMFIGDGDNTYGILKDSFYSAWKLLATYE